MEATLQPQAIRYIQPVVLALGVQNGVECTETSLHLRLGLFEMKHLSHLLAGLAPCSGMNHGQRSRDAGRRKEVVACQVSCPLVEIEGKLIARLSSRLNVTGNFCLVSFFEVGVLFEFIRPCDWIKGCCSTELRARLGQAIS